MRRTNHFIIIWLAMLVASSNVAWAFSPLSKSEAGRVVKKFCEKIVTAKLIADPTNPNNAVNPVNPADLPEIYRQVVTSEVADLYGRAVARSEAVQAATGGKPVMGDRVWTGVPDATSTCLLGSISGTRNRPKVEIRYVLVGDTKSSVTDFLVLKKELGEWKVDDIIYNNGSKLGLRSILAKAISELIPASQ
ncbi:hypothetical protein [Burkholderia ubonensis]|uniref:hypothetical protein n=1 Tax=Burkholderia ubonensis TaxID=101571 RepID=UPI0012FA5C7F|nr:hypothetical protein [Burkholderia ubonensis]